MSCRPRSGRRSQALHYRHRHGRSRRSPRRPRLRENQPVRRLVWDFGGAPVSAPISQSSADARLAGVATPAAKVPLHFAKGAQAAMEKLLRDCAAEESCRAEFPDLPENLAKVLATLDNGPVAFIIPHPKSREPQSGTMSRGVFAEHLKNLLYNLPSASLVPLLIQRAGRGDRTAFGRVVGGAPIHSTHAAALGTYLTVTCSESIPFIDENEIGSATEGTFMGDYRIRVHRQACREWRRGPIPAAYLEPVHSSVPVLMLSGELDAATPPQLGPMPPNRFQNGRQILLRNNAHSYTSIPRTAPSA